MKHLLLVMGSLFLILNPINGLAQTDMPPTTQMTSNTYKAFYQMFIDYPEKSLLNGEQGNVVIAFETDQNGTITYRKISQGISKIIDSTALVFFDKILWNPGKRMGKNTTSTGTFEIEFHKKKYLRLAKKRGYKHPPINLTPNDSSNQIVTAKKAEVAPKFNKSKGDLTLNSFILDQLKYPENAKKLGISGDVKIKFVIELNGLPSNIIVLQHVGGGCTEEAIRLVEETKWIPGQINGLFYRTYHEMVITFKRGEVGRKPIPNQSNSGI